MSYRLFDGKIPTISQELINTLIQKEALDIEPEYINEVELDIQAVLKEYLRMDRELMRKAKDITESRGLPHGQAYKQKRRLAKEKQFKLGEDAIGYLAHQFIETFYHSNFVEEVYADDNALRRIIAPILKKHMGGVEEGLDKKVRNQLKNIKEGSEAWDIEYQRAMGNLKRKQNLE